MKKTVLGVLAGVLALTVLFAGCTGGAFDAADEITVISREEGSGRAAHS